MRNHFTDNKFQMCVQYISSFTRETWPEETLNIDGVYQLQLWRDGKKCFAAVKNVISNDWMYVGRPK